MATTPTAVSGPVNFLALTFPSRSVDASVVETIADVVRHRDARVLDLVYVVRDDDGTLRTLDVDDHLDRYGLAPLAPEAGALMSDDDVDAIASTIAPGGAAVLIVYENVWAVRVAEAVRASGGEVALLAHVPVDAVREALAVDGLPSAS